MYASFLYVKNNKNSTLFALFQYLQGKLNNLNETSVQKYCFHISNKPTDPFTRSKFCWLIQK